MNEGVEILLARMDSHPDEFDEYGPWAWVFNSVVAEVESRRGVSPVMNVYNRVSFLSDEELHALLNKYKALQARAFTNKVMSQLLNPPQLDTVPELPNDYMWNTLGSSGTVSSAQTLLNTQLKGAVTGTLTGVQHPVKVKK